jgi:hypothetical protein
LAACLHTNQSRSYLNHLVLYGVKYGEKKQITSWPNEKCTSFQGGRLYFRWNLTEVKNSYSRLSLPLSLETNSRLVRQEIFQHFMEPEISTSFSQNPANCPYTERDETNRHNLHYNCTFPSMLKSSKWHVSFRFRLKTVYEFIFSPVRAILPVHLNLTDLITWIIFGD